MIEKNKIGNMLKMIIITSIATPDLTVEELGEIVNKKLAQIRKEKVEGKRDKD